MDDDIADFSETVEKRILHAFEERVDEVVEGVDGGEARHVVALVLLDGEVDLLACQSLRNR